MVPTSQKSSVLKMQKPNSIQLKPLWSLIVNEKSVFSSSLRYPNNCKIIHTYAHTPSNKVCLTHLLSQFQLGQRSQTEPRVNKQLGKLNFVGNCRRCIRWSLHLKPEHKKKKVFSDYQFQKSEGPLLLQGGGFFLQF